MTWIAAAAAVAALALGYAVRSWIGIVAGRIYRAGDRVRIAGVEGEVIAVRPLRTKLVDDAGSIVSVPNAAALRAPVHRLSRVRHELRIGVSYRADWAAAERILLEEAKRLAEDARVYVSPTGDWLELAAVFAAPPADARAVRDELARAVLRRFDEAGIALAARRRELTVVDPLDGEAPAPLP